MNDTYTERSWRSPHILRIIALFLLLTTSFAAIAAYPSGSPAPTLQPSSSTGDYLSIPLEDVDGNTIYLRDFEGKVVVLEFMATWCITCAQQEQIMKNEFYPKYRSENLVLISVTVDPAYDTPDVLRNHIATKGIDWLMTRDTTLMLTDHFKVMELSTTLIITPDGEVKDVFQGLTDMETLSKAVDPLL